jgi:peptidoglycan/LPS O-acetylase OafA/YrhL
MIGIVLFVVDSAGVTEINKNIYIPDTFTGWITNLFIFNLFKPPRIVPPAWSLAIELNWYMILFVASFFPRRWVLTFLVTNLLWPFVLFFVLHQEVYQPGAGFAFALGAIAYHIDWNLPKFVQYMALATLPVLMYLIPIYFGLSAFNNNTLGVTVSLMGSVVLLYIAMPVLSSGKSANWFSNLAGELSYPVFLTHHYAAWFAVHWFNVPQPSWMLVFAVTLITLIISFGIVKFVEHPIAKVRMKIRNRERI